MSDVIKELDKAAGSTLNMGNADVRKLAGRTGDVPISMGHLRNKSNVYSADLTIGYAKYQSGIWTFEHYGFMGLGQLKSGKWNGRTGNAFIPANSIGKNKATYVIGTGRSTIFVDYGWLAFADSASGTQGRPIGPTKLNINLAGKNYLFEGAWTKDRTAYNFWCFDKAYPNYMYNNVGKTVKITITAV
ncbi:hypothetical protein [Vibrio panuliri]|uniref:Uncharacterized protein n=1 Tax=Vibrio panuliri TaxID=1381081 RepID=A0ABX3FFK2_9VIBR|nr:hypothetical protein [Vibrio panuliri]KAB1460896.1 hypothetical protein F7O85_00535 [Vibrio panuliri]OLQ91649.1 hypothetical protein BIY20_09610 [Vibrio panuliri]